MIPSSFANGSFSKICNDFKLQGVPNVFSQIGTVNT